jgi:hypothetical protein
LCWFLAGRRPAVASAAELDREAARGIEQDVNAAIAGVITLEAGSRNPSAGESGQARG